MSFILVIDQGTHASRAILFSETGEMIEQAEQTVSLNQISHEAIEQDASELLSSIITTLNKLDKNKLNNVSCCGIATQRSTIVAWDKNSGIPLHPALSWQDRRCLKDLNQFKPQIKLIKKLTGLPLSPHYGAGKIRWLLKNNVNVKQAYDENNLFAGPLVSYLLYNLLDEKVNLVDHSNANRMLLLDSATLEWSKELIKLFELPDNILPKPQYIQKHYGNLLDLNIPITSVCGDQSAALFANGYIEPGTAIVNIGTGAFVLSLCKKPITESKLLTGIAFSNKNQCDYLLEGTVNGAGAALSWAENNYPTNDLFKNLPLWIKQETDIPIFINTIGGLGSPWWTSAQDAYFLNDEDATIASRYVAIIESIVFLIQHNLEHMQQHINLKQLRLSGGLSQLDGLCQKIADLSGLVVERMPATEATARGAAWLAAGCPDNWEIEHANARFSPSKNTKLIERYQQFSTEIRSLS